MDKREIVALLKEQDENKLGQLWAKADKVRADNVGDYVHLRALVEISNICSRNCLYCNLGASNKAIGRYRLDNDEILACAMKAVEMNYGTIVMQSGEDKSINPESLAKVISQIKSKTDMAVTLSFGEWDRDVYKLWRAAGADRFLLRFETSNKQLYAKIHPGSKMHRLEILPMLMELGYETGSGVMVGIPGQSYESLAEDLLKFAKIKLHMIGLGPYIACQGTELADNAEKYMLGNGEQVPATELMGYKAIAISRLLCPKTNIPATTALATLNPKYGYENGLARGGNVVMPNVSPMDNRKLYSIYPGKVCIMEDESFHEQIRKRIEMIYREVSVGRGDSLAFSKGIC